MTFFFRKSFFSYILQLHFWRYCPERYKRKIDYQTGRVCRIACDASGSICLYAINACTCARERPNVVLCMSWARPRTSLTLSQFAITDACICIYTADPRNALASLSLLDVCLTVALSCTSFICSVTP